MNQYNSSADIDGGGVQLDFGNYNSGNINMINKAGSLNIQVELATMDSSAENSRASRNSGISGFSEPTLATSQDNEGKLINLKNLHKKTGFMTVNHTKHASTTQTQTQTRMISFRVDSNDITPDISKNPSVNTTNNTSDELEPQRIPGVPIPGGIRLPGARKSGSSNINININGAAGPAGVAHRFQRVQSDTGVHSSAHDDDIRLDFITEEDDIILRTHTGTTDLKSSDNDGIDIIGDVSPGNRSINGDQDDDNNIDDDDDDDEAQRPSMINRPTIDVANMISNELQRLSDNNNNNNQLHPAHESEHFMTATDMLDGTEWVKYMGYDEEEEDDDDIATTQDEDEDDRGDVGSKHSGNTGDVSRASGASRTRPSTSNPSHDKNNNGGNVIYIHKARETESKLEETMTLPTVPNGPTGAGLPIIRHEHSLGYELKHNHYSNKNVLQWVTVNQVEVGLKVVKVVKVFKVIEVVVDQVLLVVHQAHFLNQKDLIYQMLHQLLVLVLIIHEQILVILL